MATTTRTTTRNAAGPISRRQPFTTSGALRGGAPGSWPEHGRLPAGHKAALVDSVAAGTVDYVVWSYGTPIAWHRTDTGWTIPDVRYSATTSRHQGEVRRAAL